MPTPTSRRSLSAPLWRSLKVGLAVCFVGVIIFVGFTRTQVGRDHIRTWVEQRFNRQFAGTLSIGSLRGSLVSEVIATGVQLRSPSGTLVATVDSVHATPQWANLLTAELSLRTLTLTRPHLRFSRDATGSWNIARALRRRAPPDSSRSLDVSFLNVRLREGRITTVRSGLPPSLVQQGWLFDYTRTRVENLNVTAAVRQGEASSLIQVRSASFSLPDVNLRASTVRGRAQRSTSGWTFSDVDLSLDTTRVRGQLALPSSTSPDPSFSLTLQRSRIDHDELRRLVPRVPLRKMSTVEGSLEGGPGRLQSDGMTWTHDRSHATLRGSIDRQAENVQVDLTLNRSRLVHDDLREVWPGLPDLPNSTLGEISLEGSLQGTTQSGAPRQAFDLEAQLEAESSHGTIRGSVAVARNREAPLSYQASVEVADLNLAAVTGMTAPTSQLTGHIDAQGVGLGRDTLSSDVGLSLSTSQIAGRPIASADGQLTVRSNQAEGTLTFRQRDNGRLFLRATADSLDGPVGYAAVLTGSELNLSPLGGGLPRTDLNARLTVQGSGTRWRPVSGTMVLSVDSSRVYRGDSTVVLPPHSGRLLVTERGTDRPRLQITGDIATATVQGPSLGPRFWSGVRGWGTALRAAFRRQWSKRAPSNVKSAFGNLSAAGAAAPDSTIQDAVPSGLKRLDSSGPVETQATLTVKRPDILHAWWAAFPRRAEGIEAKGRLVVGSDSLHATGHFSAGQLRSAGRTVRDVRLQYELAGPFERPLSESMRLTVAGSARQAAFGGPSLFNPTAELSFENRSGSFELRADSAGVADSLRVRGALNVRPETNELRVRDVAFRVEGSEWSNPSPASIYAFSNAVLVSPLVLRQAHPQTPSLQEIRIGGTLSPQPSDTLSVEADNVYLPPFSQATNLPHIIGGNLDGEIHLRSGLATPHLDGNLSIRRLSYDRRLLGSAQLQAEYSAESPDLILEGSLGTKITSVDSLPGPDFVPNGARRVDPNRLSLSGRVQLPQWAQSPSINRPSRLPDGETLDLSVEIERADLFFFRYIFEERVSQIQGFAQGPLHIGGRFRDPVFNADLSILNGGVTLPLFGLQYRVQGQVDVDRQGIHPRNVRVRDDEGTATVDGSILFNDYQFFSFDLSASVDGITVIDVAESENLPFYGFIRASGPLTLRGPLSNATLRTNSARTTPDSELYIPVSGQTVQNETGFIVFTDSTGQPPAVQQVTRRQNILGERPEGVPTFVEGLDLDLNVTAPEQSTVHLVFDPVVGDVVTVLGSGRVQLRREEGDFSVFGKFEATEGTYQFTAGEVFVRRFNINEGTITWDGDPVNAQLDLYAEYQTRASPSGLPGYENYRGRIPVTVDLHITGRVSTPRVDLGLSLTRDERSNLVGSESLDAILNQPARTTEYATSVLLTNTFLLTTESIQGTGVEGGTATRLTTAGNQLAFNSVSQLVSSQLNRYLGEALPNVDLNFGVQGEDPDNLDLIYGVALRLLNERLIIRGEGVYTGDDPDARQAQGPQGEFVVEVRLTSRFSAEVFYRRRGDELTRNRALTSSRGAGLSYRTQFSSWGRLFNRLFGWLIPGDSPPPDEPSSPEPVAGPAAVPPDSTGNEPSGQP